MEQKDQLTIDIATLKEIPLFSNMDDNEIADVRKVMELNQFAPGQVIVREGDEGESFHVILQGNVQFIVFDADGNELVLDESGRGNYFGELSMLTGQKRVLRVRAIDAVLTVSLGRSEFHDFLLAHPHASIDVLTVLGQRLYQTDTLLRRSVSRNVNEVIEEKLTIGQKIADGFAATMGSWPFIIVQSLILIAWVTLNLIGWQNKWDPYPFILLNLALSFQAAYAAPIIMMSQNRQSDKDRLAAEIDHEVNVKAEIKVGLIMGRLDDLEKEIHYLHSQILNTLQQKKI